MTPESKDTDGLLHVEQPQSFKMAASTLKEERRKEVEQVMRGHAVCIHGSSSHKVVVSHEEGIIFPSPPSTCALSWRFSRLRLQISLEYREQSLEDPLFTKMILFPRSSANHYEYKWTLL